MAERPLNLFYLPPGVDFATELVRGLQERMAAYPPEAMARVQVFVNSQRMRRRVLQVMTGTGTGFLPNIRVVADLEAEPILADLEPAVPTLRQRLEIAGLIKHLLRAEPELAPMTARFDLAESLALLLAEMQDEGVSPERIADLDVSGHSAQWARTQAFLRIVTPLYANQSDKASRQRLAGARLVQNWQANPPQDLVIVAGSTGSRGTTARLMQAVAGLAHGAVVVPGFDTHLPAVVWNAMRDSMTDEDHPQFRFRKLAEALGAGMADFVPWRQVSVASVARNQLVSLALRPAPVTDQWLVDGRALPDLHVATEGLSVIEASTGREEAAAIALVLRHAVEGGQRAALITPDRTLVRRVEASLARWGIVADDSAGTPLALSAPGRLLRHVAQAMTGRITSDMLLILLKHPKASGGQGRGQHLICTRALEVELRRNGPAFPTSADLLAWGAQSGREQWAAQVARLLDGLAAESGFSPLSRHVARHVELAEILVQGLDPTFGGILWRGAAGEEARRLIDQILSVAGHGDEMSATEYQILFDSLIAKGEVREPTTRHPLVAFYGHREAREMYADLVIMGGLTDGVWPASADPDPWLNRKMRKDAGLLLPERQIGLAAHDFQQAIAAKSVILSRAIRDAEAETVPSRWVNRLFNLMEGLPDKNGPEALKAMRARGALWLEAARRMDRPSPAQLQDPRLAPAKRPQPQPPLPARPKRLSLTRVSTLIRDPYAIYARYVLNLKPMEPLRHKPDDRDRGTLVHEILEGFVRERPSGESRDQARARLIALAKRVLEQGTPFPSARLLWLARLERAADHLLRQDAKHGGTPVLIEQRGAIQVGHSGVTLFGIPDRIDLLPDGKLHLIDYKTGSPPTKAQQDAFDKQLLLSAAMAEKGGFADLGPMEVGRITYIGLGSGEKAVDTEIDPENLAEQWARFAQLIAAYGRVDTGYTARRAVFETRFTWEYDHLSRFGEWQMSDRAEPVRVGTNDAE